MNESFIKLYRKFREWEWYDDIPTKVLFLHLMLEANFADANWRGEVIKRGTLHTGRYKLAEQTGLSENQVRRALKNLEKTKEITIKTTNSKSVIELNNYSDYQSSNQQKNQRGTNKQPTNNQQRTTVIEETEEIEKKEEQETVTAVAPATADEPKAYGNPEINKILNFIKTGFALTDFKEPQKQQRQYARHLLNLGKKLGLDEFQRRFNVLVQDDFKSKNCNSIKYLYRELKSVPAADSVLVNSAPSEIPTL